MNKRTILLAGSILTVLILVCAVVAALLVTAVSPARSLGRALTDDLHISRRVAAPTPVVLPTLEALPTPVTEQLVAQADAEELLLTNLYERVNPSVVNIEVYLEASSFEHPALPDGEQPDIPPEEFNPFFSPQGQGSGFVYSTEGHIITNNHVVEGATRVEVTFFDGTQLPAEIIGTDPDSDLAVIKVDAPPESLSAVVWGDSDSIQVGQRAVAIGNPFGLNGSLTSGIISALGRSLPSLNSSFRIPEIIQVDAAVNPGNSGGPLLNSHGEVVGVINAIVPRLLDNGERSFLGVGFAIPGNLARRVVPAIIEDGYYAHPWIGIVGNSVTSEIAEAMSLESAHGALVVQVLSDSPADKAGLRGGRQELTLTDGAVTQIGGDVIIGVEDEPVNSFDDLLSFLSRRGTVDQTIALTIIRDGRTQQIDLTLEPRPTRP